MSKAEELIAGLETHAQFDSDGSFSLDRDKAREKMRQFQLADPHRYVLLLVEAAVLRGATTIVFDIDADDMQMRFDAALSWQDLDELYGALFINRTSDEIRARRELALACNAVMALNPRWVRIESFTRNESGATQGIFASLRSDQKDEISKLDMPSNEYEDMRREWTAIHVKERFRPGLMVRFLRDIGGSIPEEQLLRTRCQHASTAITLDGVRISGGLPKNLVGSADFSFEHMRGVAGIDLGRRDSSGVTMLSNGVEISTHELGESIDGLWYWVDSSRFRKDVSQGDIVRGEPVYEQMLGGLAIGRDRVLGSLADRWHSGAFLDDSEPTVNEVFDLLRGCFVRWADANWLRPDAGPLGHLARLPLWRTVDHKWLTPLALLEQVDSVRGVMYTERDFAGVTPQGWGPIIHVLDGETEVAAIRRVYPQAESVTIRLEREVPWEQARRKWRARPHALELPQASLRNPMTFEHGEYRGRVAFRPGQLSDVRVIVDGCLLSELELDLGALGLCAVITGPLTPAADYARPRADREYATVLMLLLAQVPTLLEAWAGAAKFGDMIRSGLLVLTQPDFAVRWLVGFGFSEASAKQMLERLGTPMLLPPLGLGPGQVPSAVAKLIGFATVDQRRATLLEIELDRRERKREPGKLLLVNRPAPNCSVATELMLHVDADDRRLLTAMFGADVLHDDTASYLRERGRHEFEARPERRPTPPLTMWTTEVTLDRVKGHVGVSPPKGRELQAADQTRRATIEVFTRGRMLCTIEEQSWLPNVDASLAWEGVPINNDWNGIEGSRRPLRDAIERGLIEILKARAEGAKGARPSEDERRILWLAIVSPFISVELFRAWRALRAHFAEDLGAEHASAVAAYCEVMELFPGVPLADLREAIKLLLDDGKLPDRSTILALLNRDAVPPGGGREFQRAVLGIFPLLESVPLVASVGAPLSLAQVVSAFESTGEIAYVDDPILTWDGAGQADARVIVRADEVDQVALIRLFGREVLQEVSAWIHERRSQQRFESRKPLEHIRVPDTVRLVGVEFERDGFCGELAIPDRSVAAGSGGITKITFCHGRRVIEEIELHAALPVIGIVDDAQAVLLGDYSKVDPTTPRMAALRRLLDEVLANSLLPKLAEQYDQLDVRKRSVAWSWIAAHWRGSSIRGGSHPNRLTEAGKQFAQLKLFQDTDGTPRSLAELIERFAAQRKLWYVERHPGHQVSLPFPIVEARADHLALLDDMFSIEDFTDRWRARVAGDRRKRDAKRLPTLDPPSDALVSTKLQRNELKGSLWLPDRFPFAGTVTLGANGKIVEVCDPVPTLPVIGIIGGDGLEADDGFESVPLTPLLRRYLESQVVFLYTSLLSVHERELARPDKVDFTDPVLAQRRSVRLDILRAAAIGRRRAELRRVESAGADMGATSLEKRLYKTPLLLLNTGRLISIDVAAQARPQELAHLGIWTLDGPILAADERARLLLGEELEVPESSVTESSEPESSEPALVANAPEVEPVPTPPPIVAAPEATQPSEIDQMVAAVEREMLGETPTESPRDPVVVLLDRIRDELRLLRERHEFTLSEGLLDCIHALPGDGKRLVTVEGNVTFDSMHPRFTRALADPDPIWVSFLASVAYTGLNHWLEDVSDDDELGFHAAHANLLLSALLTAPS